MKNYRKISRITGAGYLLIFITGFFANFYVLESLIVDGDSVKTISNIMDNAQQFHWGLFAFVVMVLIDFLLAFPLYALLRPVNKWQSRIGALLRIINAFLFGLALVNLFRVSALLRHPSPENIIADEVMSLLTNFNYIWTIGLIFFGLHLLVLGMLIYKAGYFPRWIGFLLFIAGAGYLIDSNAQLFLNSYDTYKNVFEMVVVIPSVIGEFSLTLWLLIRGVGNVNQS